MSLTPDEIKDATEPVVWVAKREGAIYGFWRSPPDPEQDPGAEAVYESDAEVQMFIGRSLPEPTSTQKLAAMGFTPLELKTLISGK